MFYLCVECFSHIHLNFHEMSHKPPWRTRKDINPPHERSCTSSSPPWPARNCWNVWKLWPSWGVLASQALALGSLGKNQPPFCQSAVFPLQRAVIIFLIWISPKQELLPIHLICEAIKQVGILSSYFSHFQARLLTPVDAAYLFLQIMSFILLKK